MNTKKDPQKRLVADAASSEHCGNSSKRIKLDHTSAAPVINTCASNVTKPNCVPIACSPVGTVIITQKKTQKEPQYQNPSQINNEISSKSSIIVSN